VKAGDYEQVGFNSQVDKNDNSHILIMIMTINNYDNDGDDSPCKGAWDRIPSSSCASAPALPPPPAPLRRQRGFSYDVDDDYDDDEDGKSIKCLE
jgi:hypothetical protein